MFTDYIHTKVFKGVLWTTGVVAGINAITKLAWVHGLLFSAVAEPCSTNIQITQISCFDISPY